ncbi:MAG: AAA family ATPase [Myxococcales bacterium]|nr:AAA family ATPase [Myxococcales bacterium]MCB9549963.1 AAA family ATPase [Myxococcales bacterium]
MTDALDAIQQPTPVALPGRDSVYLIGKREALALKAALAARRPLLVRGLPGCGKSQLAHAAAALLGRGLVAATVDARTEPHDLLYQRDDVGRLAAAQIAGAVRTDEALAAMALERFIIPGPLWWGLSPGTARTQAGVCGRKVPISMEKSSAAVVLVDEIDKAEEAIPNALLDAFGQRGFDVPGYGRVGDDGPDPLIILTTNEERPLSDAFVRRCLVLRLELPRDRDGLVTHLELRGQAHFKAMDPMVIKKAAGIIAGDRLELLEQEQPAPGMAEFVDLLRAVDTLRPGDAEGQKVLLDQLSEFVLKKHLEL